MDKVISIIISASFSLLMYLGFVVALKSESVRDYMVRHWYYHPNAICVWRVFIGLSGILLYFVAGQHAWGILLFTVSAVLDGVDGLIARKCDLITPLLKHNLE